MGVPRMMELKGFSKDQLKGKQLSLTFQPDALVIKMPENFGPEDD